MNFSGAFPRKLLFERGGIEKIPEIISDLGLSGRCMLITGKRFARSSGYLDKLKGLLESAGVKEVLVFDRVEPNPSASIVDEAGRIAAEHEVDFVVGFGGGSALDTAKGVAVVAMSGKSIKDYFYPVEVKHGVSPVIAIPTTCGTGSEVTKYAVISYEYRKNVVLGDSLVPIAAILDSEVLSYLPREVLAHTAMDALSHAIESYFHIKSNELTYMFSAEALKMILENFARAYDGDPLCREKLFYASMVAGLAINLSGTVVVHGLGYYLTEKYGVPHGLANALFLPQLIRYSAERLPERLISLCQGLGISSDDAAECSRALVRRLDELRNYAGLPMNLLEAGIPESELERIVEEGLSYRRNVENYAAPLSREDVEQMVRDAFGGARS
ncbi:MAG: iron-containing alcohol dehydrogenase [Nitrososphaerota archaeon]